MDYSSLTAEDLVRACVNAGDTAAWEEFVCRFNRVIGAVVLRTARRWGGDSPRILEDLIQDVYLKLCANNCHLLRTFTPSHKDSVYGFISVVAANLVHDHFKALSSAKRGGAVQFESAEWLGTAPSKVPALERPDRALITRQIDDCLLSAETPNRERDRRIFWLYYRVGLTASEIARLPSIAIGVKGVESTLLRLTRLVRKHMVVSAERVKKQGEGIQSSESL